MCVKNERNDRQRKNYRTPSMTIHVMRSMINLLEASPRVPGAGGDQTPEPDEE